MENKYINKRVLPTAEKKNHRKIQNKTNKMSNGHPLERRWGGEKQTESCGQSQSNGKWYDNGEVKVNMK